MQQTKLQTAHVYNPQLEQPVVELYHKKPFLKVCIVMPTYNESGNIVNILDRIYTNEKKIKEARGNISINVLVVDDNSPDGTSQLVKEYSKKNSHVYLLKRKNKEGLGKAYIAGMKYAMKKVQPDIVFEMDADGQHNPDYIPKMIEEVENGSDFVIGSRYIGGGATPKEWGWQREAISYFARSISRI